MNTMAMTAFTLVGVLASALPPSGAQGVAPTLTPIFNTSGPGRGPAFLVECVNGTGRPLSSGSDEWPLREDAIRIDGQALRDPGGGKVGPGLTVTVQPGEAWRGYIEFWQAPPGVLEAVRFGAMVRAPFDVPLAPGRHTIAIRCGQRWSGDTAFFIEK